MATELVNNNTYILRHVCKRTWCVILWRWTAKINRGSKLCVSLFSEAALFVMINLIIKVMVVTDCLMTCIVRYSVKYPPKLWQLPLQVVKCGRHASLNYSGAGLIYDIQLQVHSSTVYYIIRMQVSRITASRVVLCTRSDTACGDYRQFSD